MGFGDLSSQGQLSTQFNPLANYSNFPALARTTDGGYGGSRGP